MDFPIRINKYLRDKNIASRREADKLVQAGLVFINSRRAENGSLVQVKDKVLVKEARGTQAKERQYLAYYKPRNLPTQDQPGKRSVITDWQKKGLYPVGRLDKQSEGLLLLTNDGVFARKILSTDKKFEKEYIATVKKDLQNHIVKIIQAGMETTALGKLLPAKAQILSPRKIKIILVEGKKHQIRVMLNDLGYTIVSLKRIRIGRIKLGKLKPGETRRIKS